MTSIEPRMRSAGSYEDLPTSMQTRAQYMTYRLRPLLAREMDVVFVCSAERLPGLSAALLVTFRSSLTPYGFQPRPFV